MGQPTVVLVPGVTGSEIGRRFSLGLYWTVWLSPATLAAGGLPWMGLPVDGEASPAGFNLAQEPGLPLPFYYGLLTTYLIARGWTVVSPFADWRQPIYRDSARLVSTIRESAGQDGVVILCHSRGGLVTRHAMAVLAGLGQLQAIKRVVGMGVPHTGSLNACRELACYGSTKRSIERLGSKIPGFVAEGTDFRTVRACVRSWPSVYELMPAPNCGWLDANVSAGLYTPVTWAPFALPPVAQYLSDAAAAWGKLPPSNPNIEWVDVVGMGIDTYDSLASLEDLQRPDGMGASGQGDGTVPLVSAAQPNRRHISTPTQHGLLPQDFRLFPYLHDVLANGLQNDVVIEGDVFRVSL